MSKSVICTANAPAAIGTYSQAVRVGYTVYLAGQIGLGEAKASARGGEAEVKLGLAIGEAVVDVAGARKAGERLGDLGGGLL